MLYYLDEVNIDGIECYFDWLKYFIEREVERFFIVDDVIVIL